MNDPAEELLKSMTRELFIQFLKYINSKADKPISIVNVDDFFNTRKTNFSEYLSVTVKSIQALKNLGATER